MKDLKKNSLQLLIGLIIILVMLLSWMDNPALSEFKYMPYWLGEWCDQNPRARTGVPFLFLALFFSIMAPRKIKWIFSLVLFVVFVEIIQLFIPNRHCDIFDILFGWIGIILGILVSNLYFVVILIIKKIATKIKI